MLKPFSEGVISDIPESTRSGATVTWFERLIKRVHAKGGYFESRTKGKKFVHAPRSTHKEKLTRCPSYTDTRTKFCYHLFVCLFVFPMANCTSFSQQLKQHNGS